MKKNTEEFCFPGNAAEILLFWIQVSNHLLQRSPIFYELLTTNHSFYRFYDFDPWIHMLEIIMNKNNKEKSAF